MAAQFDTVEMESGSLALVLEPKATWGDFSAYSKMWMTRLGAKSISEPIMTVDECMLGVEIQDGEFWITYDDFQSSIQLEPREPSYNRLIVALQKELRSYL